MRARNVVSGFLATMQPGEQWILSRYTTVTFCKRADNVVNGAGGTYFTEAEIQQ